MSIIALMIVDSIWSDQAFVKESSNPNESEEFHFIFVNDLDPSVLALHQQVIQFYFEATQIRKTKCPKVIQPPPELFERHLTSKPISYWKAMDLAKHRENLEQMDYPTVHCFETPGTFYKYPNLKLLISNAPVRCHSVHCRFRSDLSACFEGLRWAVFEIKGQNLFHFDLKKWSRVPAVKV